MFHLREAHAARLIRALTLGLLAIAPPLAARGLCGPPGTWAHVRWQRLVDAPERQRLETRLLRYTLGPETTRTARRHGVTTVGGDAALGTVDHPATLLAALAIGLRVTGSAWS